MGDFKPEAQVKGFFGCNLIAFICNKYSATFSSVSNPTGMSQMYIIYVKDSIILIQEGEEKKSIAGQERDNKYVTIEIIAKIRSLLE